MIKNKSWFTLIEILISMTIIIILWVYSFSWLHKSFLNKIPENEFSLFLDKLSTLDENIWKLHNDYTLDIIQKPFYIYTINSLWKDNTQSISFDETSFSWTVTTTASGTYSFFVYKDNVHITSSTWETLDFYFVDPGSYQVQTMIWWEFLNPLFVEYFSQIDKENLISFDQSDIGTWITLQNLFWQNRKIYWLDWTTISDKVGLWFRTDQGKFFTWYLQP